MKDVRYIPFIFFCLFFFGLFLQFPLQGSLPQNTDTWFYIGLFNDFGNHIRSFFTGEETGSAMYPMSKPHLLGEPSYLSGLMFLFFKMLGANDIWAYYFFISLVFILNACSVFLLVNQFVRNYAAAFYAALVFSTCNFGFALLDNQNALVYFPMLFSLGQVERYLAAGSKQNLYAALFSAGSQIYFSSYIFVFMLMCFFVMVVWRWKGIAGYRRIVWLLPLSTLLLALPFFIVQLGNPYLESFEKNEALISSLSLYSMQPADLLRSLPYNIIMPFREDIVNPWMANGRSAYIGFSIFILAVIGVIRGRARWKYAWLLLYVISLILALGPYLYTSSGKLKLPLYYIFNWIEVSLVFRNTARIYMVGVLALAVLAALGIKALFGSGNAWPAVAALSLLFLFENVPYKFRVFDSKKHLQVPPGLDFFREKTGAVIAQLPSSIYVNDSTLKDTFNTYNREFIYMYEMTRSNFHTINGLSGYPYSVRMKNGKYLRDMDKYLDTIISANELDYLVLHKKGYVRGDKNDELLLDRRLKVAFKDEDITIYSTQNLHGDQR